MIRCQHHLHSLGRALRHHFFGLIADSENSSPLVLNSQFQFTFWYIMLEGPHCRCSEFFLSLVKLSFASPGAEISHGSTFVSPGLHEPTRLVVTLEVNLTIGISVEGSTLSQASVLKSEGQLVRILWVGILQLKIEIKYKDRLSSSRGHCFTFVYRMRMLVRATELITFTL